MSSPRALPVLRDVLDGRDWMYVMSLLVPLTAYNLGLKAVSVLSREQEMGGLAFLGLVRSDLLFNAGYAVFWIGLFAVARRGAPRAIIVVLFHAVSLLVAAVTTVAFQYFQTTGSTLDWGVVVFYLATLGEIRQVIVGATPAYAWTVLAAALLYVVLGPWLAVRLILGQEDRREPRGAENMPLLEAAGLGLVAFGFVFLSLAPNAVGANQSFSLSPPVNLALTGLRAPDTDELAAGSGEVYTDRMQDMRLKATPETDKRNVVTIVLDSTPARATTPYNEDMETTPFMDELSKKSTLVERAYTTIPHTSKAMTSINCGIYPDPETDIHEAQPGAVPVRCLPKLLGDEGYRSVWFQSATEKFEDRPQLVENLGYDDFYGLEDMDREGFQRAGYLGYEDDIMLDPSKEWLKENAKKGPFLATYLTITAHHEYLAPTRYGRKDFVEDDVYNRFLNSVRYEDFFVKNVIDQYKALGLYEETIFVIVGDHGEAFGEHGVKGHDGVPYEEGLRVPLIIHDPQNPQGRRVGWPTNHPDLAPTILDLLGYETAGGGYPGASVLGLPVDRTLFFGCRPDLLCTTSTNGDSKYIYNYGKRPDELYDLSEDPLEKNDLAAETPDEELKARREELLEWRAGAAATYDD